MKNGLAGLQPQLVFKYFEEISQIPRGSGNEKAEMGNLRTAYFKQVEGMDAMEELTDNGQ